MFHSEIPRYRQSFLKQLSLFKLKWSSIQQGFRKWGAWAPWECVSPSQGVGVTFLKFSIDYYCLYTGANNWNMRNNYGEYRLTSWFAKRGGQSFSFQYLRHYDTFVMEHLIRKRRDLWNLLRRSHSYPPWILFAVAMRDDRKKISPSVRSVR